MTFLDQRKRLQEEKPKFLPDSDLMDEEKLRCTKNTCLHVFKNDTAGNRHYALIHDQKGSQTADKP